MTRALWRVLGVGLLGLPLLPVATLIGAPDVGPDWLPYLRGWAIAALMIAVAAALIAWAARRNPPVLRPGRLPAWPVTLGVALLVTILAIIANRYLFAGNPHLVDEMAQLLHARALAAGMLALPVPPMPEAFLITHTWITEAGWASQYPPGQTALFALGMGAGAPEIVNPLLAGIATILLFVLARGLYGTRTAVTAVVLWGLCAWVVFMSASFMNHVGAMVFGLAAWAAVMGPRRPRWWHFVLAGAALGAATITRPLDGAAAGVPLIVWAVTRRRWAGLGWAVVGGLPLAIAWGWFNQRLYGSPFTMGYSVLYGAEHGLGFHDDPWGQAFTPAVALSNLAVAIRRLHIYAFEWPIPALLPLGLWALVRGPSRRPDRFLAVGFLAVVAFYFPYWHSGFFLGPRFYFVTAPVLVIGTARAWRWLWREARARARTGFRSDVALITAAAVVLIWGTAGVLPERVAVYRHGLPTFKLRPLDELEARGVQDAIVLVPESFGARTIVSLWAAGARPGVVERAYRWMDTCELWALLEEARAAGWPGERLEARIEEAIAARPAPPGFVADWPDPTIKIGPPPPPACEAKLRTDLAGFTLFGPHAWRNPVDMDSGIVFVRHTENVGDLLARWPGRAVWRYAPPPDDPRGMPVLRELGTVTVETP